MSIKSYLEEPGRSARMLETKSGRLLSFDVAWVQDDYVIISDSSGNLGIDDGAHGMTMNSADGVLVFLNDISWISKAKKYLKPTQGGHMASVEKIEALKAGLDELKPIVEDEKKVEFDKGFDEGVKQNVAPGDKIYSQEEMNAELAPRDAKIAELTAQVEADAAMIAALEAKLALATDGAAAVAAFKAELLAKYEEQQVAETSGEVGFKELLV